MGTVEERGNDIGGNIEAIPDIRARIPAGENADGMGELTLDDDGGCDIEDDRDTLDFILDDGDVIGGVGVDVRDDGVG